MLLLAACSKCSTLCRSSALQSPGGLACAFLKQLRAICLCVSFLSFERALFCRRRSSNLLDCTSNHSLRMYLANFISKFAYRSVLYRRIVALLALRTPFRDPLYVPIQFSIACDPIYGAICTLFGSWAAEKFNRLTLMHHLSGTRS